MRLSLIVLTLIIDFNVQAVEKNWQTTHFIWNFGIISLCNKGMNKNPWPYFATEHPFDKNDYYNLKPGDIAWVQCKHIPQFCQTILSTLKAPITVIISDGDDSFPSNCAKNFNIEYLLNHPSIIHVFAQNCDYEGTSKKISHIPIGIDFHTIAYKNVHGGWGEKGSPKEQEKLLITILNSLKPTHTRIQKAYVDFHLADTMHGEFKRYLQFGEDRKSIFEQLLPTGLIDHGQFMRRSQLWRTKGKYAFSISPHGNGLDCHRTWEDLILGCIVIVKTSPLDPLYEGLPVVIINNWSEITQENMIHWIEKYGNAFTNPEYRKKLTHAYWFSKIKTTVAPYK